MDKDQETIDMVLDIPNSISLNPFDRPLNFMEDELNSVTQEELEANLSTDCPFGVNIEKTPPQNNNDILEQLIQRVLEDTSTQDGVVNSEQSTEFSESELKNASTFSTQFVLANKEKTQDKNCNQESLKVVRKDSPCSANENENEECSDKSNDNEFKNENKKNFSEKMELQDEKPIEKECIILDVKTEEEQMLEQCIFDVDIDDDQADICQVEVYASSHEDERTKKTELYTEKASVADDYDTCSDDSVMSIGYLEPVSSKEIFKNNDIKDHQLSSIISDHCYSQESDVLKQNLINHIVLKNPINVDHKKISKFVDKILNNLNSNNLERMLNTLNLDDKAIELAQIGIDEDNKICEQKESNNTSAIGEVAEISQKTINIEREKECLDKQSEACLENPILVSESNTLYDSESGGKQTNSETFAENCSEPMEHQLFEEEFELLCKNGLLPLKNDASTKDAPTKLLENLKDFASHMLTDCKFFSSTSTNLEEKLLDYIKTQYKLFQEVFAPQTLFNCSIGTQTELKNLSKPKEISKKLRKRNHRSKSKDHSSSLATSSSTSSPSSEDEEPNTQIPFQKTEDNTDTISDIKSLSLNVPSCDVAKNYNQDYDDGINLSQYVQSEIFDIDSPSPQSSILSEDSDSGKEADEDQTAILKKQESLLHEDEDSDNAMIFDINSKKSKVSSDNSSSILSSDGYKTRKSQKDDMSVHSESDKENLTTDRKDKKSIDSLDEDEKNDREIDR